MAGGIDHLIINSPYEKPARHWSYNREKMEFKLAEGRRPAGYVIASGRSRTFDDPGIFIELPLVNKIRKRVDQWRESGYPGVTGITRKLLEHWRDPEERQDRRFFFCQLEAIETLIWLIEAPEHEKAGIEIPSDGGDFRRLCGKMATGSGKTIVMAMTIAWQVLNKVTYPQDTRFSKNVLVVAPGLTVKSRLKVLKPSDVNNYYQEFNIIPPVMITVCNRTETAARIEYAFNHGMILIDELKCPERTLRIDSKVLEEAESRIDLEDNEARDDEEDGGDRKLSKKDQAEQLRQTVDTVGQAGKPGGPIQNVIAVAMLSEGWDAKTVTHIMGLRAFSSQLLRAGLRPGKAHPLHRRHDDLVHQQAMCGYPKVPHQPRGL